MKYAFLVILAIAIRLPAQDITILKPNQAYTPKETRICLTEIQFNKLDSLLADTLLYQKQISLLIKKQKISDSLELAYQTQLQNRDALVHDLQLKDSLLIYQDSLYVKKAEIYKGLSDDLQKSIGQKSSGAGFFNNTFWFGTGVLVGTAAVYLSSMVLQHIK